MDNINSAFLYQKIKLKTVVLNSEYSFLFPNFIDKEFKENNHNDCLMNLYNELREGMIGIKLDSFNLIANMEWRNEYYGKPREKYYFDLCKEISNDFFKIRSGQLYIDGNTKEHDKKYNYMSNLNSKSLEVGKNTNNKFKWIMLKQMIDVDILIGVYLVDKGLTNISDMILWDTLLYTTDTLLEKVLEKGTAELHMHVGASRSFTSIWTEFMNLKTKNKLWENLFKNLKNKFNYGKINFEKNTYLFRLIRILLAVYIRECKNNIYPKTFEEFMKINICDENVDMIIQNVLKHIENERYNIEEAKNITLENIQKAICFVMDKFDLQLGPIIKTNFEENYYEEEMKPKNATANSILSRDILTLLFNEYYEIKDHDIILKYNFEGIILPEQVLIFEAMKFIDSTFQNSNYGNNFEKLFWHYVKFKNLVYRQIIQEFTVGKGLDMFQSYYKRQNKITIDNFISESFYSQIKSQNIKKFEIRTGAYSDKEKVVKLLLSVFKQYKSILEDDYFVKIESKPIPLIGIVFHFNKRKDKIKEKCAYDSEIKNKFLNYLSSQQEEYLKQAKIIGDLRCDIDLLDYYLVGIDTASNENNAEPYIFREAFNYLRSIDAIKNRRKRKGSYLKEIGFTNHVGEEFRDLISGLRHIDETIELFNYKSADRLGHAIALGIDVDKWAEFNQVVCINAEEYLDNLLWEWNLLLEEKINLESTQLLEQKIYEAVEYIFGFTENVSIRELYKAYYIKITNKGCYTNIVLNDNSNKVCALQDYTKKKYCILNDPNEFGYELNNTVWSSQMIYRAMQCKYFTKELEKNVTINIDNDTIENYKKIQQIMIKKVGDKQIVVETNPTSNLVIGEFKSFEDYYITNLSSPEKEKVIVTINTDDPVIFDTRINNEYALIYDILMRKEKYSSKEVIDWLDKIRKNSLDYSFIQDRGLNLEELKNEIDYIIEQLRNYL